MSEGRMYQMTPMGIREGNGLIKLDVPVEKMIDVRPTTVFQRTPVQPPEEDAPAQDIKPSKSIPTKLRPGDILKMAQARVREIRVELREHKRLEKELAELERLIAAAKATPLAAVRPINPARRTGGGEKP